LISFRYLAYQISGFRTVYTLMGNIGS
jgi:hypothetical protein